MQHVPGNIAILGLGAEVGDENGFDVPMLLLPSIDSLT